VSDARPSRRPPPPNPPRPSKPPPAARASKLPPPPAARASKPPPPPAARPSKPPPAPIAPPPEPRRVHLPLESHAAGVDPYGEPEFPDDTAGANALLMNVVLLRVADAARATLADAGPLLLRKGDTVLVEAERGATMAVVAFPSRRQLVETRMVPRVLRRSDEGDLKAEARARLKEAEAVRTTADLLRTLNLPAKVLRVEISRTGQRVVVHLSSEDRIELRELGRLLNQALRSRVEIRHVGARDAAKAVGGVGPCGLQLCCNTFLAEFAPVSIRHAKEQGLALKPERVSGVCGRLMCCLVYEDAFYRSQRSLFPKPGKRVLTPKGEGRVRDVDVLARTVRVALTDGGVETFPVDALLPAAPIAPGTPTGAP
jgi:cell fate regulator YaaT (PSP1 superfamily)